MEFGFISQKVNIFPGPPPRGLRSSHAPGPGGPAAPAVSASCRWLSTSLPMGAGGEGHREAKPQESPSLSLSYPIRKKGSPADH